MHRTNWKWVYGGIVAVGLAVTAVQWVGMRPTVAADEAGAGESPKAQADAAKAPQALQTQDLSLSQADAIVAAAIKKSQDLHINQNIAVVDAGGNLKGFARMDGAWLGSIDIAIKKAKTARYFDMPTGDIGKLSQPGGPLYNIEVSNGGLITFPGGRPIRNAAGAIIGAVGVSGSTVENDDAVAKAGVEAIAK